MANVTFWKGTRAQYTALAEKLDTRLYFIEDEGLLYKGSTVFSPIQNNTLDGSSTNDSVPGSKAVVDFVTGGFVSKTGYIAFTQDEKDKLAALYGKEALDALLNAKLSTETFNETIANYDTSEQVTTKINTALSSVLVFKGVVADETALSAITGMKVGDVYYVTDKEREFVYTGTDNDGVGWEELGPTVDYSVFAQKNEVVKLVANAAADHVAIFQAGGELKDSGYTINTGNTYAGETPSGTIVVTETVLAGVVASIVAGDLGDALNGKMGIVATAKAGELLIAKADGNSEVSGFTISSATSIAAAGSTSNKKLVNETAVRAAIDAAALVWIEG